MSEPTPMLPVATRNEEITEQDFEAICRARPTETVDRIKAIMNRMPTRERMREIIARAKTSWPDGRDPWLDDEHD
jgi:hypothetical protein